MRKSRFTDEQIIVVLHEWDEGARLVDLLRKHRIPSKRSTAWKTRYSGMQASDVKRLKALDTLHLY